MQAALSVATWAVMVAARQGAQHLQLQVGAARVAATQVATAPVGIGAGKEGTPVPSAPGIRPRGYQPWCHLAAMVPPGSRTRRDTARACHKGYSRSTSAALALSLQGCSAASFPLRRTGRQSMAAAAGSCGELAAGEPPPACGLAAQASAGSSTRDPWTLITNR